VITVSAIADVATTRIAIIHINFFIAISPCRLRPSYRLLGIETQNHTLVRRAVGGTLAIRNPDRRAPP
jgi:hypothetical protein